MPVSIALICLALFYFIGYRRWSLRLYNKVFQISSDERTPAHDPELRDDVDYLPVGRHLLWGHHYASIAGAAPIIGPAVAIIWGWLPALIWIVLGTIFIGAGHDFGALVLSVRHKGKTMGAIAGEVICPRVRVLFKLIIYFLNWIVLAVFSFSIGVLFHHYQATVIPINFEIIIAIVLGILFHKYKVPLLIPSILALVSLYAMVAVGLQFPISLQGIMGAHDPIVGWAILLLLYAAVACVLPVWLLLQPRDYINSHQLIVGLFFLFAGLFALNPSMQAPAVNLNPPGAPPIFPMIFVTIACGAISGFHGLVSSGTTSKQLDRIEDSRPIAYGGMLGEGTLAVVATLAVAAGLEGWDQHYHSWNASGIQAISHFVQGAGRFLEALHIPVVWAQALVAVLVISFAATSMDTAARIQRHIVSELGESLHLPVFKNRYLATLVAVGPAIPLVMAGKEVWGPLWLLFGTTNQLIGAMTLLILYVYLFRAKRPTIYYAIPMLILIAVTTVSMLYNLMQWSVDLSSGVGGSTIWTIVIAAIILLLELWMIIEAVIILRKLRT